MVDLSTKYLGLDLKNPLVASASPLSHKVDTVRRLEEAGIAAVVLYSLFEEQIIHDSLELDHYLTQGTYSYAEALTYLPDVGPYNIGPDAYVDHLHQIKQSVNIPVIGSLNGVTPGGWINYAKKMEEAGADALELNIYSLAFDPMVTSAELEENHVSLLRAIRAQIKIPIAVKISPFFTGLANVIHRLAEAGADGMVLFNRFYQPDFDLEQLEVVPNLVLSTSHELRLPLRWIALLYGTVEVDFALTSGVHTAADVLKAMMAGACVTQMASELLKNGIGRVSEILLDLQGWMEEHEYESISQMKGSLSAKALAQPSALWRANYVKELSSFTSLP